MMKYSAAAVIAAGLLTAAAVPAAASAATKPTNHVTFYLDNQTGGTPADYGRGITVNAKTLAVGMGGRKSGGLAHFYNVHVAGPTGTNSFITFDLRYGTGKSARYLHVNASGAALWKEKQVFGVYAGAGFNGPRYVYIASTTQREQPGPDALTADWKKLHSAPVGGQGGTGNPPVNWNQVFNVGSW